MLSTTYLGLTLEHPIVASASPISRTLDGIRKLEDGGASAIVLFSLFEEQLRREQEVYEHLSAVRSERFAESLTYFPPIDTSKNHAEAYLTLLSRACEAVNVPIIASLNASTEGGWASYAWDLEQAGASAIEINLYELPLDLHTTGSKVEERYVSAVKAVASSVKVPVTIKLSPYFSAVAEMAQRIVAAGASGLVLFNRFYQPDIDLAAMEVLPTLELSRSSELRLPLLWIGALHGRLKCSLAASTGVHSPEDAIKCLLVGADAVMTTSSLLARGPGHLKTLVNGLKEWIERSQFDSVQQLKGVMSLEKTPDPTSYARANYLKVLHSFELMNN
jgi:dihydroorotate dehydrogenase (fumarate)